MDDLLEIPADLDRTLALGVLSALAAPEPDPSAARALDGTLERIVAVLRGRGARAADVLDALEDAFAALLAAHESPSKRDAVQQLHEHARSVVRDRLRASDGDASTDGAGRSGGFTLRFS